MIRTLLFNIVYYVGTLVIGILIVPSLLLPERLYLPFIRQYFYWVYLTEKYILGLDYVVIGRENLPEGTPYIVAAKHQSAYETLKLPLLFQSPVVIVKQMLLQIPFWGWYAAKAGMIGIDRSRPREAMPQMIDGVKHAVAAGRTVVIFPQGTRTSVHETTASKPYKRGIAQIYEAAQVPVIPMAVNTGLFWPRNAFMKRGGQVTIKFLPPIAPGMPGDEFMQRLEDTIESETAALVAGADLRVEDKKKPSYLLANITLGILAFLILLYTGVWHAAAYKFQIDVDTAWHEAPKNGTILSLPPPRISGFPGPFRITWSGNIFTRNVEMTAPTMRITLWGIPGTVMTIEFPEGAQVQSRNMGLPPETPPLQFKYLRAALDIPAYLPPVWIKEEVQKLHDFKVVFRLRGLDIDGPQFPDFSPVTRGSGELRYDDYLQPGGFLNLEFSEPEHIRDMIVNLIPQPMGKSFAAGAINGLMRTDPATGKTTLPLTFKLQDGKIYAGPIKVASIGFIYWPVQVPQGADAVMPFSPPGGGEPLRPAPAINPYIQPE